MIDDIDDEPADGEEALQQLSAAHPLPWRLGTSPGLETQVVDANGAVVCTFAKRNATAAALAFVELVERELR